MKLKAKESYQDAQSRASEGEHEKRKSPGFGLGGKHRGVCHRCP